MDIQRPASVAQAKKRRQYMFGAVGIIVIVLVSVVLARLKPAAPTVERATVWVDTVKRGPMVRQVRGMGTLVPEEIRWIPAATDGRVERVVVQPGTRVEADTVVCIVELMKLMNRVSAGRAGVVTAIPVGNGLSVEKGEPIVYVQPDPAP